MSPAWFETFFRGVAVDFWVRAMTPAFTLPEVDFLEKALAAQPGARLLDLACGSARHAIALARRGYRMTGVDLSPEFLALAARSASQAGVEVDLHRADMRALELPAPAFDGAYCFGNSFGYLDASEARALLAALARALGPAARLVIDTGVCAESILPSFLPRRWHRLGDMVVLSECRYVPHAGRLDIDYTFIQGGVEESRPASSYVMTVAELSALLRDSGFAVVALAGGLTGEPFHLGSPRLLLTAQRS
jgi:SAM-dependent methyltransferase